MENNEILRLLKEEAYAKRAEAWEALMSEPLGEDFRKRAEPLRDEFNKWALLGSLYAEGQMRAETE